MLDVIRINNDSLASAIVKQLNFAYKTTLDEKKIVDRILLDCNSTLTNATNNNLAKIIQIEENEKINENS
jgi:hypothetical protein